MAAGRLQGGAGEVLRDERRALPPLGISLLVTAACLASLLLLVPERSAIAGAVRADTAGLASSCTHRRIHTASLKGSARITTIRDRTKVPSYVNPLRGTYANLASTTRLWIFVWSSSVDKFYPQTHKPDLPAELRKGQFRSSAAFGGASGEHYEVAAVLATARASQRVSTTLRHWRLTGNSTGWTQAQLPRGLEEKHCVAVVLK